MLFFFAKTSNTNDANLVREPIAQKWLYFLLITAVLFYEIPSSGMWAFMERFGVEYINMGVSEVGSVISLAIILSLLGPVFIGIFGNKIRRKEIFNSLTKYKIPILQIPAEAR